MEQIKFLDHFIRIYGIQGLSDYETKITSSQYKNEQFLDQVNLEMVHIKKFFKTSLLNLARKNYIIDSPSLALNLLKNCLQQANVPFEIVRTSKNNFLRLNQVNKTLVDYINKPVEDISHQMENVIHEEGVVGSVGKSPIGSRPEPMDFCEHMSKCVVEKVFVPENLIWTDNTGSSDPLTVMCLHDDPKIVFTQDVCMIRRIFDLIVETDEHWIVEIPIVRQWDVVYQFEEPKYLIQVIEGSKTENKEYFFRKKDSYLQNKVDYNGCIDRYCVRIGNEVFPISLAETNSIGNGLNLVACQLVCCYLQIYYQKSAVMSPDFLKSSLMLKYVGGLLYTDVRKRAAFAKIFYKQTDSFNRDNRREFLEKPVCGRETYLLRGKSQFDFKTLRIHDFIVENQFSVRNLDGTVFNNLIAGVAIMMGGNLIMNQPNYQLKKIVFDGVIPDAIGMTYHETVFKIILYQPLLDDQFVCIEQKFVDLSMYQKNRMGSIPWLAKYGEDVGVMFKDGMSHIVSKEQLTRLAPMVILDTITFDRDVIEKGKAVEVFDLTPEQISMIENDPSVIDKDYGKKPKQVTESDLIEDSDL